MTTRETGPSAEPTARAREPIARSEADVRRVIEQWRRAGPALARVRRDEIAAMTDEEALAATLDLLDAMDRLPSMPPRPSSGLVEQQRWFLRIHRSHADPDPA